MNDVGARVTRDGVVFTVWAPAAPRLAVDIEGRGRREMTRGEDGVHELAWPGAAPGDRYWLVFDDGRRRADPASRYQPEGIEGPSEIVDPASFAWTDQAWRGVGDPGRQVIYEMHVGTFTREGTWRAAMPHLEGLAALGVTTIEMMPVGEFPGRFGWGYDGVFWFAPSHLYGRPEDLAAFVDAAHGTGLAVVLDVVYNHFGPVGNYLRDFAPAFFSTTHRSEWGEAIELCAGGDGGRVRAFIRDNARAWIADYHLDGLRLDATHQYFDEPDARLVPEIARAARAAAGRRRIFVAAENEPQDVAQLRSSADDGCDALWNEDWHHAAMVALTGRREGYLSDYTGSAREFASMVRHGCLYQGQWYAWQGKPRGTRTRGLRRDALVQFLQNHDQVANLAHGERPDRRADAAAWRALSSLLLLSPGIPLLFQGQEYGATTPFCYFADADPGLAAAIREGRAAFLEQFPGHRDPRSHEAMPDPADVATFHRSRLRRGEGVPEVAALYADLLAMRRDDPVIGHVNSAEVAIDASAIDDTVLLVRYEHHTMGARLIVVNLGPRRRLEPMNDPLLAPPGPGATWRLRWSSEAVEYGGGGVAPMDPEGPWTLPPRSALVLVD